MYFRNNFFFLSNMYHYEIINNHIVVNIDGQKYLIDTGSPISFHINPSIRSLTIDGISYPLQAKPAMFNVPLAFECIGNEIDGFIGLDIITKTSLSLLSNQVMEFKAVNEEGIRIPLLDTYPFLTLKVSTENYVGRMIIDTGAKFAYGIDALFINKQPLKEVNDYNPTLGSLKSNLYKINLTLFGKEPFEVNVAQNDRVSSLLSNMHSLLISNLLPFYKEFCIIDMNKKEVIIK